MDSDYRRAVLTLNQIDSSVTGSREDGLDYARIQLRTSVTEVRSLAIDEALQHGLRIVFEVESGVYTLTALGEPRGGYVLTDNGLASAVFGRAQLGRLRRAIDEDDLDEALSQMSEAEVSATITYEHQADRLGFHWIGSALTLRELLTQPERLRFAHRLLSQPHRIVIVEDMGRSHVTAGGLRFAEPGGEQTDWRPTASNGPWALAPCPDTRESDLADALRRLAFEEAWLRLATDVMWPANEVPVLRFEGARTVVCPLDGTSDARELASALALWEWCTATDEIDRREAIEHASSLAIAQPGDLAKAANRVLPTARSVYRLSRQGVVAEALSARRAVRDAAIQAGRSAAIAASQAAATARDRVLIQIAAAIGIAIAYATEALSRPEAIGLLLILAFTIVLVGGWGVVVDLPVAEQLTSSFLSDLRSYSDALSQEDETEIAQMDAFRVVEEQVKRSKGAIIVVTSVALLGVMVTAAAI